MTCPGATTKYAVCGSVRNPEGQPIAGVQVRVEPAVGSQTATTGVDGRYTLSLTRAAAPHLNTYLAPEQGYVGGWVTSDCGEGSKATSIRGHVSVDITLQRGVWVTVRVLDPNGVPTGPGQPLDLYRWLPEQGIWCSGRFSSETLFRSSETTRLFAAPGTYRLKYDEGLIGTESPPTYPARWYGGALTEWGAADIVIDKDVGLDLTLARGHRVTGKLTNTTADRYWMVDAQVREGGREATAARMIVHTTEGFTIVVPAGTYRLRTGWSSTFSDPGDWLYWRSSTTYDLAEPVTVTADVTLDLSASPP